MDSEFQLLVGSRFLEPYARFQSLGFLIVWQRFPGLRITQTKLFQIPESWLGSFSIDDGDGREIVTLKSYSRFFKRCRVYSNPLKMSNVGQFLQSCFLGTALKFRKRKKNSSSLAHVLHKAWNQAFSRRSRRRVLHIHMWQLNLPGFITSHYALRTPA